MERIPTELWLQIFETFDDWVVHNLIAASQFWNIRRTCRLFNKLIRSFMLRRLEAPKTRMKIRHIILLCMNPDLRSTVRSLVLMGNENPTSQYCEMLVRQLQLDLGDEVFHNAPDAELRTDIVRGLRDHSVDAADAALLWMCRDVQEVVLRVYLPIGPALLHRVLQFRRRESQFRKLSLRIWDVSRSSHGAASRQLGPLFGLPTTAPRTDSPTMEENRRTVSCTISSVATCSLTVNAMISSDLTTLVEVFPNLRNLSLRAGGNLNSAWTRHTDLSPERVSAGLRPYSDNLHTLDLSVVFPDQDTIASDNTWRQFPIQPTLAVTRLSFLARLTSLRIPDKTLFGFPLRTPVVLEDILPRSLQTLIVVDALSLDGALRRDSIDLCRQFMVQIRAQIQQLCVGSFFPDLRVVVLEQKRRCQVTGVGPFIYVCPGHVSSDTEAKEIKRALYEQRWAQSVRHDGNGVTIVDWQVPADQRGLSH